MSTDDLGPELPRDEHPVAVPPSGWHPVNVGHLVMGVAFVGLVAVWALITSDTVELKDAHWILPLPWLVAGALGLVASVLRAPRPHPGSVRMKGWLHDSPDSRD